MNTTYRLSELYHIDNGCSNVDEKTFMDSNEIYKEKKRDLEKKVGQSKDVKRQIDVIKKSFNTDSNYEWMNETQNKVKTNKKTLVRLRKENEEATKMLDKHERLLQDSEELQAKSQDLKEMKE